MAESTAGDPASNATGSASRNGSQPPAGGGSHGRSRSRSPSPSPSPTPTGRGRQGSRTSPGYSTHNDLDRETQAVSKMPNYRISESGRSLRMVYLLSNVLALSFMAAVVLGLPNTMNGGTAVFKSSEEFVGVLRKCSATSCDPWLAGGSAVPRSDNFSYGGMFLTLGLASLTSLWFSIYITIFGIYRMFKCTGEPLDTGGGMVGSLSRYAYHAARVLLFINAIITFALIVDVFRRYIKYKLGKTDPAVGWGVGLLVLAFLFATLSALIDLGSPGGRTHRFIQSAGCGGECGGCNPCSCCSICSTMCWDIKDTAQSSPVSRSRSGNRSPSGSRAQSKGGARSKGGAQSDKRGRVRVRPGLGR